MFGLIDVILKIILHFLKNKTPEAKKAYVNNLQKMSKSLVTGDVDSINDLFYELREQARQGDPFGFGDQTITGRKLPGDSSLD